MKLFTLRRLHSQQIASTEFTNPKELVSYMGAMQAQEFAMAKWAIALRTKDTSEKVIDDLFNAGEILRTHVLRPTWHFVTPEDIRWIVELTAPRVNQANAYMCRQYELTDKIFDKCNNIIAKALQGGKFLEREELNEILAKSKIKGEGIMMSIIMMRAELDGVICSGPRKGNQFTYALLEERAPKAKKLKREEALAELTKRFFISRGPATVHDLSYWSGLTIKEAKEGVELVKSSLDEEEIEGEVFYFKDINIKLSPELQTNFLLPDYDEMLMSYKDKTYLSHKDYNGDLTFNRMLVLDGAIVGTWKRTLAKDKVKIELVWNVSLSEKEKSKLITSLDGFGKFLGKEVEVVISYL